MVEDVIIQDSKTVIELQKRLRGKMLMDVYLSYCGHVWQANDFTYRGKCTVSIKGNGEASLCQKTT